MSGSFALAEELFARGDPAFVAELRKVHDADRLAAFAARWLADRRPAARQLLLDYLAQPLNTYRHEPLVKRLFKGVEKAGDDELMGAFLVAFDRWIRRQRRSRTRHKWESATDRATAQGRASEWASEGFETVPIQEYSGRFFVSATKREDVVIQPNNKMPRHKIGVLLHADNFYADRVRGQLERRHVLFSIPTRRYLRRRAWRYFRRIVRTDVARYRNAASAYLKRYADGDVDSEIHLLDNWGLVHTLFGDSPALRRPARGWEFAPGATLAHLSPAPRFAAAWLSGPEWLFDLLRNANCRTVRYWAALLLRQHHQPWLNQRPLDEVLALTDHAAPEVAELGFELLENRPDLASIPVDAWLARLNGDDLDKLDRLSKLLMKRLDPQRISLEETVRLACHRSLPVARLGKTLLGVGALREEHVAAVLPLTQAECETIRPDLAVWLRRNLAQLGAPRREWLLEFLDSKHADVRAAGWAWLNESELKDDPTIWQRLMESPYDDVKMPLIAELTKRVRDADQQTVTLLWASVLLNIHRGGRYKPGVVGQIVARLEGEPDDAERLLPLLAVAVRSLRGPEFRAGLCGVVSLHERRPQLRPAIARAFPELSIGPLNVEEAPCG